MTEVIVGVDLGSSAVKASCFDLAAMRVGDEKSVDCSLKRPREGWVEHDLACLESALREVLTVAPRGATVGIASAMHGLVLLDARGTPLLDAISWADQRSAGDATWLLHQDPGAWQRTGTPLHPMAWPAKLRWAARQEWWKSVARVTDLKSYLWERLVGEVAPLDPSSASGTGLRVVGKDQWDQPLLDLLELDPALLPEVRSDHRTLWDGRELHLGGADGPLGNLGLGATAEGRIAISVGTSGAVRQFRARPDKVRPGLFLYALDSLGWVEGGAISNGGSVMEWLGEQSGGLGPEEISQQAYRVAPGAGGVRVYPYFHGERAPFWRAGIEPQVVGPTEEDFAHLARATLEGVAYCLRRLLERLPESEEPLRCTGGMFTAPAWRQLLADVSGRPVGMGAVDQATAFGAALLTQKNPLELSRALPLSEVVDPDPAACALYRDLYEVWQKGDTAEKSPRGNRGE